MLLDSIRKYWFEIFVAPFLVTYFLPYRLPNNVAILWLGLGALFQFATERKVSKSVVVGMLPMLLLFGLQLLGMLWTDNKAEGRLTIEMRSVLLIMPIVFMLHPNNGGLKKLLNWLTGLLVVGALGGLFVGLSRYLETTEGQWFYNDNLTNYLGFQAVYYAHLINFALFNLVDSLINEKSENTMKRLAYVVVGLFLVTFHFLLACRIPLFILFAGVGLLVLQSFWKKLNARTVGYGALGLVGLLVLMFFVAPKTFNRFETMFQTDYDYTTDATLYHFNDEFQAGQWTGSNLRLAVWDCIIDADINSLIGVGTGDKLDQLTAEYASRDFKFALEKKTGPHNQYLEIYLTFGWIGVALFLLVIGSALKVFYKKRNLLSLIIVLAYIMGFMTEDILNRNQGIVMFAFIYAYTMAQALDSTKMSPKPINLKVSEIG